MKLPQRSRLALLLFPASLAFCVLLSSTAFGQVVVTPPVITTGGVSATTIIVASLAILVGYVTQGIQSGSLFGVVTIPKSFLPYLGLLGGFLGAFTPSITNAPVKDEAAWLTALFAGLIGLGGIVAGVTAKQHLDAHLRDRTPLSPLGGAGKRVDAVTRAANDADATKPPAALRENAAVRAVLAFAALAFVAVVSTTADTGCANNVPTPQTQAVINASANLALCVETVIQQDESATPPAAAAQVILDEGVTCAGEALALVNAIGQEMTPAPTSAGLIANVHADVMARRAAKTVKGH